MRTLIFVSDLVFLVMFRPGMARAGGSLASFSELELKMFGISLSAISEMSEFFAGRSWPKSWSQSLRRCGPLLKQRFRNLIPSIVERCFLVCVLPW